MFNDRDMVVPAVRVEEFIGEAIQIHESQLSDDERAEALKEIFNDRIAAREFLRNFESSQVLRDRLASY